MKFSPNNMNPNIIIGFVGAVALQINSDTTHVGDHSMTLANVVLNALAETGLGQEKAAAM